MYELNVELEDAADVVVPDMDVPQAELVGDDLDGEARETFP